MKYVQIHRVEYCPGCVITIANMDEDGERDYPIYGKIEEIIIWDDEKYFVVDLLELSNTIVIWATSLCQPTKQLWHSTRLFLPMECSM